jgi:large subunit ribosomal protein L3
MINTILGKKLGQTQGFLEDGKRIPMTRIDVSGIVVSQIKTAEKDGYDAVQLGYGTTKKADKPTTGHTKKAGLTSVPRFFKETRADKMEGIEAGSAVNVEEVLSAGDIVDVTGTTKGKGYAGVVKRHHFKGGPKTHGQSDRHRAPGSIGQSTTPGRVYKGKRMAGRMGAVQATVKNLEVVEYADGILLVKGLIPGPISSIVTITRRGTNKKHMGLYKEPVVEEEIAETKVEEIGDTVEEQEAQRKEVEEEVKAEEAAQQAVEQGLAEEDKTESVEEVTAEAVEPEKEEEVVEEKK